MTSTQTVTTSSVASASVLPKRTQNAIAKLRKPFAAFVNDMETLTTTRADLAPLFMKTYNGWKKATGSTFVSFCRLLDASIPEDREGYRGHRSYAAADYLRRVASGSPQRRVERTKGEEAPISPLDAVARTLAILVPLVPNPDRPKLWEAITAGLHWTDRQILLLKQRVEQAAPLVDVRTPRGAPKEVSLVVH